ncbi:MAG TPA: flagella basal body P-ring formation protein FlgA [Sphingomonas sp.]|nr:flagella basal body P-ring formation protein FlgA [Sphingomonas sp.]
MIIPLLLMAASFQDTAALDASVAAFTGRPTGAEGGARTPVDARLRLATCPTVSLSWRSEQHDAVVVSCTGPAWRIFVPVIRPAGAPAAVSSTFATSFAPPIKAAPVIKRGDPIVIEAGTEGFSISREGVAMGDAAPGGRFMVKVDATRTPVQAIAVEAGRATLPGWSN